MMGDTKRGQPYIPVDIDAQFRALEVAAGNDPDEPGLAKYARAYWRDVFGQWHRILPDGSGVPIPGMKDSLESQ